MKAAFYFIFSSSRVSLLTLLPRAIVIGVIGFTIPSAPANPPEAAQVEEEWNKAQQEYYRELKKMPVPRNPETVRGLKERLLEPKRKALIGIYQKLANPEPANPTVSNSNDSTQEPSVAPAPTVILDGAGVKKEIRYTRKGAPVDMTEEESPEFEGPQVLASPSAENAGEIAYPARKKKSAQDLKKRAP